MEAEEHEKAGKFAWKAFSIFFGSIWLIGTAVLLFTFISEGAFKEIPGFIVACVFLGLLLFLPCLVIWSVGKALFWDIPIKILRKKYDEVPRSKAIAGLALGVFSFVLAIGNLASHGAVHTAAEIPTWVLVLSLALVVGGVVALAQGLGALIFRSRQLGIVVAIYLLLLVVIALFVVLARL